MFSFRPATFNLDVTPRLDKARCLVCTQKPHLQHPHPAPATQEPRRGGLPEKVHMMGEGIGCHPSWTGSVIGIRWCRRICFSTEYPTGLFRARLADCTEAMYFCSSHNHGVEFDSDACRDMVHCDGACKSQFEASHES